MEIQVTLFHAKFMEYVMVLKTYMLDSDRFAIKWNLTSFPESSPQGGSTWIALLGCRPCMYHPVWRSSFSN